MELDAKTMEKGMQLVTDWLNASAFESVPFSGHESFYQSRHIAVTVDGEPVMFVGPEGCATSQQLAECILIISDRYDVVTTYFTGEVSIDVCDYPDGLSHETFALKVKRDEEEKANVIAAVGVQSHGISSERLDKLLKSFAGIPISQALILEVLKTGKIPTDVEELLV